MSLKTVLLLLLSRISKGAKYLLLNYKAHVYNLFLLLGSNLVLVLYLQLNNTKLKSRTRYKPRLFLLTS